MHCSSYRWLTSCGILAASLVLPAAIHGQPPKPTIEQLREAAGKGEANAQTDLAYRLWNGDGVAADQAEANKLFRQAADKGHAQSQYALGFRLKYGLGVAQDIKQSAIYYNQAAVQGHPLAMKEAAIYFAAGRGLPVDTDEAVKQLDSILAKSPAIIKSALNTADKCKFFDDMTSAYFDLNANSNKDRKAGFDKVREVLDKHAAGTSLYYTVEGDFYTSYAWDARTGEFANKVTAEQFRVFEERLQFAAETLEKGWSLDNKNAVAASRRIAVAMGLGETRPDMELWFKRAVKADPDNINAYLAKMLYLEPKWHGDGQGQDMLEFARECGKSGNWKAEIPFLLIYAHEELSTYPRGDRDKYSSKPDPKYFAFPDVWTDVQSVYEPYLKLRPDHHAVRSKYALYAAWAGQWTVANDQFRQLGDKVVKSVFDSPDELERLRREASSKAQ